MDVLREVVDPGSFGEFDIVLDQLFCFSAAFLFDVVGDGWVLLGFMKCFASGLNCEE